MECFQIQNLNSWVVSVWCTLLGSLLSGFEGLRYAAWPELFEHAIVTVTASVSSNHRLPLPSWTAVELPLDPANFASVWLTATIGKSIVWLEELMAGSESVLRHAIVVVMFNDGSKSLYLGEDRRIQKRLDSCFKDHPKVCICRSWLPEHWDDQTGQQVEFAEPKGKAASRKEEVLELIHDSVDFARHLKLDSPEERWKLRLEVKERGKEKKDGLTTFSEQKTLALRVTYRWIRLRL